MPTTVQRIARRHRGRARSRGVALAEAAVILPLFVVLWFVAIYAHDYYVAQLDANANSRRDAWGYAMTNCGTQGDPVLTPTPVDVSATMTHQGNTLPPMTSLMAGDGRGNSFLNAAASLLASLPIFGNPMASLSTHSSEVHFRNAATKSAGKTTTSSVMVFCNEAPENGNVKGIARTLWDMLQGMLPW